MPLPTAAELTDPNATNTQMKQRLGQLAENVASKEELNEQVGEAKDQAEQAIDKIDDLGVVHNYNKDLIFAILDELGRRTWLGVGSDGKPDQYTVQCIEEAISIFVNQISSLKSKDAIEETGIKSIQNSKILFAVTDALGRKTAFELGMDGKLTEYAASSIADSIGIKQAGSNNSLLWALTDADGRRTWLGVGKDGKPDLYTVQCMREALNVEEKANVLKFCFDGDSMTAGAGGNGNPVTKWFNELLVADGITNAEITNFGVGGETSVTICARQGGNPFIVTVDDGVIPATAEPVRVTLQPINDQPVRPMLQGASSWAGELNGLKGTLRIVKPNGGSTWDEANYYTFTRSTAGSQITANRPMEFHLDIARQNADAIHVIWIGQNGPSVDRAISDAKAMIERIESPNKKFIVISKPTSTDADDAKYFEHFGNRFIAARKYLVQYGLEDAGIAPTAQDLTDIQNGIVPTSLRSDAVHWLAPGYQILAKLLFNRMKNLGWI
ncbi:SGNH/GDSL hydrolase family protein [Acinetobacter schindleri]|nr:SGNH/GDSL hydrolase family protein [Acinetobacter schindleri]